MVGRSIHYDLALAKLGFARHNISISQNGVLPTLLMLRQAQHKLRGYYAEP